MKDLEVHEKKEPKPKSPSKEVKYFQKKEQLEEKVNRNPHKENLNICYYLPSLLSQDVPNNQSSFIWKDTPRELENLSGEAENKDLIFS
ncbi:MAG: hypothetical protein NY202_05660 [Mollicutes bacterium UO1]